MTTIKGLHLQGMLKIYREWLESIDHSQKTEDRIDDVVNIFDQVSPSIFSKFVERMQIKDHKYRYNEDKHLLLKVKIDLFEKYFTFDMDKMVEKIASTLTSPTIDILFTARAEPVAVICQRIVVRQYAVINQRIEKRMKKFTDQTKFTHCDICGFYAEEERLELLSTKGLRTAVVNGFHPHNHEGIVQRLATRNKVLPSVITTNKNTQKWLDFVHGTEDVWRLCDQCLLEIGRFI